MKTFIRRAAQFTSLSLARGYFSRQCIIRDENIRYRWVDVIGKQEHAFTDARVQFVRWLSDDSQEFLTLNWRHSLFPVLKLIKKHFDSFLSCTSHYD